MMRIGAMGSGREQKDPIRQAIIVVAMAVAVLCGANRAHAQQETSSSRSAIPSISERPAPFSGLSPQSVIHTSSPADTVHFCLPMDFEEQERDRSISAAKQRGDLNAGEPRTVRMIYFSPNDRPYRSSMVDSMKTMIAWAQRFYAQRMELRGYRDKTFHFETDAEGEPLIHQVDGQHSDNYYHENPLCQ